jgi:hypothetical protein
MVPVKVPDVWLNATVPWILQPTPAAAINPLSETSWIGKVVGNVPFTVNDWPSFAAARLCGRTPAATTDIVTTSSVVAPSVAAYVCEEPDAGFTVKP